MREKYVIVCVGAGGTGSFFLTVLARELWSSPHMRKTLKGVYIFDGDILETKNLSRQVFSDEDVGYNKASKMAQIINEVYDLNWTSMATYLDNEEQLIQIFSHFENDTKVIPIIIGCVDNHGCRIFLEKYFKTLDDIIYIDSANEEKNGQVIFSYKKNGQVISPCRSFYFPDILSGDTKPITEMSCEEINNSGGGQHIETNVQAASIIRTELWHILNNEDIHPGYVLFSIDSFYQEYISFKEYIKNKSILDSSTNKENSES